jgi:hypothetical protein
LAQKMHCLKDNFKYIESMTIFTLLLLWSNKNWSDSLEKHKKKIQIRSSKSIPTVIRQWLWNNWLFWLHLKPLISQRLIQFLSTLTWSDPFWVILKKSFSLLP